jgi:hypothetical protein
MFKRMMLVVLVVSALVLAFGIGPRLAQALPPAPTGVTIPYSGRLSNDAGQPVADGVYDFSFTLYDAETGGTLLWAESQRDVPVKSGAFAATLGSVNPLPAAVLGDSNRWLAVSVRGPGESDLAALNPRQRLSTVSTAAPASPQSLSCVHTHFGDVWGGTGFAGLVITMPSNFLGAFYGRVEGLGYGVVGQQQNSGVSAAGAGVLGMTDSPTGFGGRFSNTGTGGGVLFLQNNGAADGSGGGDFITAVNSDGTDTQLRITSNGGVMTDAGFRCGDGAPDCLQTGGADVAERVNASEALQPGDVVEIDPAHPDHFRLARTAYSTLLAGVISSKPAIVMGVEGITVANDSASDARPPLALVGRVPVRVSTENGPIHVGDLLVASATPGHAMRGVNPPAGAILGKALESLTSGTGTILVLVTLQ